MLIKDVNVVVNQREDLLVVGAGFAGLHALRAIEHAGHTATLVDPTADHDFVTRLAAVAGGTAPEDDAARPLRHFASDVEHGSVVAVEDGAVRMDDGRRLCADAVVVTVGARPSTPPIDGIEHAAGLRTATDALSLRAAIATAPSVVIVGGGATGVQLAGAVTAAHPRTTVHLVEGGPTLLGGLPHGMGRGAARILRDRGVELHLGRPVERITQGGVRIGDTELDGLVVWAGGFDADASRLGVPTADDGRIAVDADLRIAGMRRTFAAGDVAAHVDTDGHPLPMSAQIAVQAGTSAGRNAVRSVRGEPTEPATLRQRGWVLDLGGHRGLATFGPLVLADPVMDLVPPLLHDAIDLKNLLEIGGVGALRFAPHRLRSLLPDPTLIATAPTPIRRPGVT